MSEILRDFSLSFIKAGVVPPPMGGAGMAGGTAPMPGAAPMPGGAPTGAPSPSPGGGGGLDALFGGMLGGTPPGGAPPGGAPGGTTDINTMLGGAAPPPPETPGGAAEEPLPPPPETDAAATTQEQVGRRVSTTTLYAELVKVRKLLQGLYRHLQVPLPEDVLDDEEIVAPGALSRKEQVPLPERRGKAPNRENQEPRLPGIGDTAAVSPIKPPR